MKNILAIQSHVVYGHAGNSAAEFPMRRLGANVWPLNTVQFSNHTQYGKWTGCVMPPSHLTEIVQGIAAIDKLHTCDAVLSGYLGSAEQGEHILGIVRQVKAANPQAVARRFFLHKNAINFALSEGAKKTHSAQCKNERKECLLMLLLSRITFVESRQADSIFESYITM